MGRARSDKWPQREVPGLAVLGGGGGGGRWATTDGCDPDTVEYEWWLGASGNEANGEGLDGWDKKLRTLTFRIFPGLSRLIFS